MVSAAETPPAGLRPALPLVIAGFAISFMLIGGGIDTVSVFMNAIAATTDWSRSQLSLAVSVGALTAALSTPVVGVMVDRFGVRAPMTAGVALLAAGFCILIAMDEAWHFVAANVVLGPGFAACALLPITVAVTVRVPHRTALALGIVGAGSSAGALILAPTVQMLIDSFGWRGAYVAMGAAVVATPLPFLAFAIPGGRLNRDRDPPGAVPARQNSLADGLRRPGVLLLAAVMILPALANFSIAVHLVPYLTGIGRAGTTAAAALGATIGVSAIGKVAGGFVADRFGAMRTLRGALVLDAIALALLIRADAPNALLAFIALHGLALGTQIAVIPPIAVTVLGAERFGTLFGLLQLAAMLSSAIGPVASGVIFDRSGYYDGAILLWLGAMAGGVVASFALRVTAASTVTAKESALA